MDTPYPRKPSVATLELSDASLVDEVALELIRTRGNQASGWAAEQAGIAAGIEDALSCEVWLAISNICATLLAEGFRPDHGQSPWAIRARRAKRCLENAITRLERARAPASELTKREGQIRNDTAQTIARSKRIVAESEKLISQARQRRGRG